MKVPSVCFLALQALPLMTHPFQSDLSDSSECGSGLSWDLVFGGALVDEHLAFSPPDLGVEAP